MSTILASNNNIWSRSQVTKDDKQKILNSLKAVKSLKFFEALNTFCYHSNKNIASTWQINSLELKICQLADNRSFNKAVTKSLALAIISKILLLNKDIENQTTKKTDLIKNNKKINLNCLKAYLLLLTNFDSININQILEIADVATVNINNNLNYYSYFTHIINNSEANNVEDLKSIRTFVGNHSNTTKLMKPTNNKLNSFLQNILDIISDAKNQDPKFTLIKKLTNIHIKNIKNKNLSKKIIFNNQKSSMRNANALIANIDAHQIKRQESLPVIINKILDDNFLNDNDKRLPINAWYILNSSGRKINYRVGSFFSKNIAINNSRAKTYVKEITSYEETHDNNQHQHIILDFRLLDNNIFSTEKNKFNRHKKAMKVAVEKIGKENIKYACIHVPTTIKTPVNTRFNRQFEKPSNNDQTQFDNMKKIILQKIPEIEVNNKVNKNVLNIICKKLFKILSTEKMTAANGLLADTLATILAEHIPNLHIVVGCKSAKDRTSIELAAMLALKAVIHNKNEGSLNEFLNNETKPLIKDYKLNIRAFTKDDIQMFLSNYEDKLLYLANWKNLGVATNINVKEMQHSVLEDFKYHRKIKAVYNLRIRS